MARILLVDDEDCVLRTTAMVLESEGHSTVCVFNGAEALRLLENEQFDLMITDIRMAPVDGMELIKSIHATKSKMPIIAVSALTADKIVACAMEQGTSAYVKKPFRIDDLLLEINRALSKAE